jgi:hypothetical protein
MPIKLKLLFSETIKNFNSVLTHSNRRSGAANSDSAVYKAWFGNRATPNHIYNYFKQ